MSLHRVEDNDFFLNGILLLFFLNEKSEHHTIQNTDDDTSVRVIAKKTRPSTCKGRFLLLDHNTHTHTQHTFSFFLQLICAQFLYPFHMR